MVNVPDNRAFDYWVEHAKREVLSTYGDKVDVKPKSLLKFGQSETIGTSTKELVWNQGGAETLQGADAILYISSSSTADTVSQVTSEHHSLSSGEFTFFTQTTTLAGQTKTALTTQAARTSRGYVSNGTAAAGNIYIYENCTVTAGVPQDATKIHLKINATEQQSGKAATTTSNADYLFITNFYGTVSEKTTAVVDFFLEVKESGGVWRPRIIKSAASSGPSVNYDFRPFLIVPPNSDVRIMALSSAATTGVDAGFNGVFALR